MRETTENRSDLAGIEGSGGADGAGEWGTPFMRPGDGAAAGVAAEGSGAGGSGAVTGGKAGEEPGVRAETAVDSRVEELVMDILRKNPELLPEVVRAAEYVDAAGGEGFEGGYPPVNNVLLHSLAHLQEETRRARELGDMFLKFMIESKVRDFAVGKGGGEADREFLEEFCREAMKEIGAPEPSVVGRLPEMLEKVYRIVSYPRLEARRGEAERFRVEGGGTGSMNQPRNRSVDEDFRSLTERLKRETVWRR